MKKLAKVALVLFGAALVLGITACSNSAGGSGGGSQQQTTATYTVTFDTDGGSTVESQTVTAGQKAARPATEPTKSGDKTSYVFLGWYKSDLSAPFDFDTAINAATTIKAKWLEGFVTVLGSTVAGGDKFKDANSKAGVFVAGRSVAISTFWICDHEVTQAEYQAVMGTNPSNFDGSAGDKATPSGETQEKRPVEKVSWYDALVYCNKKSIAEGLELCYTISGKTNPAEWGTVPTSSDATWNAATCDFTKNGYRLPTEAEWEYAARGGRAGCEAASPTDWAGTDSEAELGKYAWYDSNSNSKTHEVKTEKQAGVNSANSLGLYDMSGNVWEWCWDWKNEDVTINDDAYKVNGVVTNPAGAKSGSSRVYRGGSWNVDANHCSVAMRNGNSPDVHISSFLGFRVVRAAN
jgi:formylglycine-generating enzyme required for sulfatase activity